MAPPLKRNLYRALRRTAARAVFGLSRPFPPMRPSAIVIGVQKCGTSALHHYLGQHPGVRRTLKKELDFFNCDPNYQRGLDYYHSFFHRRAPWNAGKITVEINPGYLHDAVPAAERIHRYDPTMKLILSVRDPIARAYSAWQMFKRYHAANPDWFLEYAEQYNDGSAPLRFVRRRRFGEDFRHDIEEERDADQRQEAIEMPFLGHGLYWPGLTVFLDYFPREQFLVFAQEEMRADTIAVLRRIERFLGLPPYAWNPNRLQPDFVGEYDRDVPEDARAILRAYYQDSNRRLFEWLGTALPWDV